MRWITFLLSCLLIAACGNDSANPVRTAPPPAAPATLSPTLIRLQRDYETLTVAHQAISDIWETLAANEPVQCGDYPDTLAPENVSSPDDPAFEPLADHLQRAAIKLQQALNFWKAECANPRSNPSPDVINEGRLAVRDAGDALDDARAMLGDIQP